MLYHQPQVVPAKARQPNRPRALSVGIIPLPGFSMLSLSTFMDLLRLGAEASGAQGEERCSWTLMGQSTDPVAASCGLAVTPWERLGDPGRFHYVVLIGGSLASGIATGPDCDDYLRRCLERGVRLAAIGGGVATLARAGLLSNRRCCVHWHDIAVFVRQFGDVVPVGNQLFLVDGNIVTCAGGFAAGDLASWMLERHLGPAVSQHCRDRTLMAEARSGNSAQPHPGLVGNVRNDRVRRAIILIEQRLCEPVRVADIASDVSLSKRQLERLFQKELGTSIQGFSRWVRIRYGLWRLRNSSDTVTRIAHDCGFADSSHFCRTFSRTFGHSATVVRLNPALAALLYDRLTAEPGVERLRVAWPPDDKGEPETPATGTLDCAGDDPPALQAHS